MADEVVADCLRDLHAGLRELKFLGSYPAAGEHGPARRRDADRAWRAADRWIARPAGPGPARPRTGNQRGAVDGHHRD